MVDWHEFNSSHHWELFLEDADGQPVCFDTPDGPQPIEVRGDFSAVAPDGVPVVPGGRAHRGQLRADSLAGRLQVHVAPGDRR